MPTTLMPDTPAPSLSVETVNGSRWTLSDQTPHALTMVVFYRGYHCPVCKNYLQQLQTLLEGYAEAGVTVIAVSMDPADKAAKTVEEWELSGLTIGYGLAAPDARAWGLYLSKAIKDAEADIFCEPGLFWVRPDGRLYLADVSNMPWARPDPAFLLSKIPMVTQSHYPARGTLTD